MENPFIIQSKQFDKEFKKLPNTIKEKFLDRLDMFIIDQYNILLKRHLLRGKYYGHESINITGDYRAIFKFISPNIFKFVRIGTHSELYKG